MANLRGHCVKSIRLNSNDCQSNHRKLLTLTKDSLKRMKRRKLEMASMASDVWPRYTKCSPANSGNGTCMESSPMATL